MRRLTAAIAVLVIAACSGGVHVAGTVPPPPGTLPPDPSGLIATATIPATSESPQPTPTPLATPSAPPLTTPSAQTPPSGQTMVVTNYLLLDSGQGLALVPVPRTVARVPAIAGATLRALLAGPLQAERDAGLVTAIPASVILLGLTIQGGSATVDLSTEFGGAGAQAELQARVAQVLYTLTQFSTVKRVDFMIDGASVAVPDGDGVSLSRPVSRDDYVSLLPWVFVDSPRWGETVSSPVRVIGKANAFEAVLQLELRDAGGATLVKKTAMATCGSGCWGDFDEVLRYHVDHAQNGQLVVYTLSARDGSIENPRAYTLRLLPGG